MKKENTAIRLKRIMADRNLRQVDILSLTSPYCTKYGVKMNKSDISQYCAGKSEPNQDKLFILGMALNVSEAWLMGFDVAMERPKTNTLETIQLQSSAEHQLITDFRALSSSGKKKAAKYVHTLAETDRMDFELQAAHARTDIEHTAEGKAHDDALMDDDSEWE